MQVGDISVREAKEEEEDDDEEPREMLAVVKVAMVLWSSSCSTMSSWLPRMVLEADDVVLLASGGVGQVLPSWR